MKRILLLIPVLFTCIICQSQNLNAYMMNIIERETVGMNEHQRTNEIIQAFQSCTDPEVKKIFLHDPYYEHDKGKKLAIHIEDSAKWHHRVKNTCYIDLDGDGQKEILFHEKNLLYDIQLAVILKKNEGNWNVVLKEYGVFSNLVFQNNQISAIHIVEFHANAYPCDIFKLYTVSGLNGPAIIPQARVHVPYYYHYPVKFQKTQRPVTIMADTLFFYDVELYDQTDFPYIKRMGHIFCQYTRFNSSESKWEILTPRSIYWAGLIENRGHFSSILVAFNLSYQTAFPDYYFIYVPNSHIRLDEYPGSNP